ncbi:MAG: C10 family peptidase, partial [Kiritimatiellae bacterium]|nr:C10 family peptidase [Kiritimatiellia bacterium]
SYTTQGGYYDWSLMPLVPNSSITDAERQTIGKLTSDIGICVGMDYDDASAGGSSASGYMLAEAFTNRYGYANALAAEWGTNVDISGTDDMKNALLSNFDAGLPVALGLSGAGGHEIVGDGYGYSGDTLYLHFNMGWSGSDDAWYAPPNMAGTYNFNVMDGFVCNVFTNSADKGGVICSGRVLDAGGAPIANATVQAKKGGNVVKATTTNDKGIYAFVLTGLSSKTTTSYTMTAISGDSSASITVSLKANVGTKIVASGSSFGNYYPSPLPTISNRSGQDITMTSVAGVAEPQFSPASCLFYPSTNVEITCATEDATIRYTLDGTDPTESSPVYSGPIFVDDDTMVKARAWKSGMNPSVVVTATYTYDAAQGAPKGDYFDNPIVISGASGSRVIADNSDYTTETGEPRHTNYGISQQSHTIWYRWAAPGSGTMVFETKCSKLSGNTISRKQTAVAVYTGNDLSSLTRLAYATQPDSANEYATTLNVSVGQGVTYYIVGMTLNSTATGAFTLTWSGNLAVSQTETSTTEVPVTYVWLDEYFPGGASAAEDYETIAKADADGDGLDTWAEYLLGTDPTNALSRLEATIRLDGTTPIVESNADTNRLATFGYQPVVKGKQTLDPAVDWANMDSLHRFFKVFVETK